jgi:hypothetical protein
VNCPHCGASLGADLRNCVGCGWKVRLSQILVQPTSSEDSLRRLPVSDIYYLFADRFLQFEPMPPSLSGERAQLENLISGRGLVSKESLAICLFRSAFIWLVVSGHVHLELGTSKRLGFAPSNLLLARATGVYNVPVGSLESRILDELYDRQQGAVVHEVIARLIGFWYQGEPYEWVLPIVKRHILSSACLCSSDGKGVDLAQLSRLETKIDYLGSLLDDFASAHPNLMTALWDSIRRGLNTGKG